MLLLAPTVDQQYESSGSGPEPARWETGHLIVFPGGSGRILAAVSAAASRKL